MIEKTQKYTFGAFGTSDVWWVWGSLDELVMKSEYVM
jgi:hypothetical protein